METVEANIDFKSIGERLREERLKKGMSQEDLAEKLDVAVAYLSRVERGGTTINLTRLGQISLILDVPLERFVTGIIKEDKNYLEEDFYEIFKQCSQDKKRLIYNIARIVAGVKFV